MSFLEHKMEQHITETADGEYTFGRGEVFVETTSDRVVEKDNEEIFEENVLINRNDIYYGFDKFESGKSNVLLITGFSGSGKTTLADELSSKLHCKYFELDAMEFYWAGKAELEDLKDGEEAAYEFLTSHPEIIKEIEEGSKRNDFVKLMATYIPWLINWCKKHKPKRFIIEGLEIYESISEGYLSDSILSNPFIIKGTSALKSSWRAAKRNGGRFPKEFLDKLSWAFKDNSKLEELKKALDKAYDSAEEDLFEEKTNEFIDTLIFDFGGVLIDSHAKEKFNALNLPDIDVMEITTTLNDINQDIEYAPYKDAFGLFYKSLSPEFKQKYSLKKCQVIFDIQMDCKVPSSYTDSLLKGLKNKGYRLLYLTNRKKCAQDLIEKQGNFLFIKYFDGGIISGNVGIRKPQPEIWKMLIEKYNLNLSNCLFIDDKEKNCLVAKSLGMRYELFDRKTSVQKLKKFPKLKLAEDDHIMTEKENEILTGNVITEEANYNKRNIYPLYIILTDADSPMAKLIKKYTRQPYAHALISFNTDLEPAYSFGCTSIKPLKFGFISKNEEDPFRNEEKAAYVIYVMYVNKMQYTKIQDKLQWFIDHKDDMKYSWGGLVALGLHIPKQFENQYFCSQFVMDLIGDSIKLPKDPSLWTPGDIEHLQNILLVDKGPDLRYFNKKRFKRNLKYVQKHQFDELKYESVDFFAEETESLSNPNLSHYFREKIGSRVDKVLSDPQKVREFNNLVRNFINRNINKLTKSGPCDMIPFTDIDHKQFQEMFGFWYNITKGKETSPNEIREYIAEYSALAHAKLNFWLNNSSQVLFYFVIRYFTMHPDAKSLNAALSIYALCIYPVMFHKYFPLGVIEPVMQYTIDNLTDKFLIKKSKHLFDALVQSVQASYRFHKGNFSNASDKNVTDWVSRIRNDQNSMLKKISNEYMKNHKEGKAARTTNEEYDSDTPIIDELENGTTAVQNIVQKVTLPIIEEGVDLVRAEAAAKMSQVSISDCRYFLTLIITDSNADTIQKFIESVLFLYIYEGKKTERDIRSTYFITWAASLFKKTNSKNPNINAINDILNTWAETSGIDKKFTRIASRINYKKAIFYYLILCIQKHV